MGGILLGILAGLAIWPLTTIRGCDERPPLTAGIIVDKRHEEAYTTTTMMLIGKVMMPQTTYHPERWIVAIAGRDGTGQLRNEEYSISPSAYDTLVAGRYWSAR